MGLGINYGVCVECNTGKTVILGNKSKSLCIYHNRIVCNNRSKERNKIKAFNVIEDVTTNTDTQPRRKPIKWYSESASAKLRRAKDELWYAEQIQKAKKHPYCEECGKHLLAINRRNISHIISKGADTALRNHPKNKNLLCYSHHDQWETGERESMAIFAKNQITIQLIRDEVNGR